MQRSHTALILAPMLALVTPTALAGNWKVLHEQSTLGFTATQTGSEFDGTFQFSADMTFYRQRPDDSAFDVTVDITSVETGSDDRDSTLADQAWFWFEKYPKAHFRTKRIVHEGGDRYEAVADLTIKSITHEVVLPFTWTQDGDIAEMQGQVTAIMNGGLTMDRTRWDVGTGDWSSGDTVGRKVDVHVDLKLRHTGDD
ncbi:MAG: YceI family protein [Halofilum sp. (in: g-proteobacteria)]|nr:YceI family protein [Halofilum sp. (in: g-proteobacteria)]